MAMRRFLCILLTLCILASGRGQGTGPAVNVNPCAPGNLAVKDKGFPIGLAYWPGGTVEDWGNSSAGLSPCRDAALLEGVVVSAYNIKVDTIALLQTSNEIERGLFETATPGVLSVVAFVGNIRSEARYIWSNDGEITEGTGVIDTLSLIAEYEDGELTYLRWQDFGCGVKCSAESCLKTGIVYAGLETRSCAGYPISTCLSGAGGTSTTDPNRCYSIIQVGTSGTDEDNEVLNTGVQLQRIQDYSLTSAFEGATSAVTNVLGK